MTVPRQCEARAGLDLRLLRATVFTVACVALSAAGHSLATGATLPMWTVATGFVALFVVAVPLAGRPRSLTGITAVLGFGQIALHTLFGLGQHDMTMPHCRVETSLMTHAVRLVYGTGASGTAAGHGRMPGTGAGAGPMSGAGVGTHGAGMAMAHGHAAAGHGLVAGQAAAGHGTAAAGLPDALGSAAWAGGADQMGVTHGSAPLLHALSMLPSLPMLLAHALAALVAGWLLRRGDMAVFRLVSLSAQGVADTALVRALRAALALVRALRAGLPGARPLEPHLPCTPSAGPPSPCTGALQHTVIRRGPPSAPACALAA